MTVPTAPANLLHAVANDLSAADVRPQLRVLTCGSVDDGKSTLIGRLLADTGNVPSDILDDATGRDGLLDHANLVDGLVAEREQGITIDVAYRYFASARRSFVIADTPGHEQYTRNMATGASNSDVAIILCDASQGVLPQTRRHMCICHLFGVRQIIFAVNKMDLVDHAQDAFEETRDSFCEFAARFAGAQVTAIPVCATSGANVTRRASEFGWFGGPTLLEAMENATSDDTRSDAALRFPVQLVVRPDASFRGYAGQVVSGRAHVGDAVTIVPSGEQSRIERIVTFDGDIERADSGDAVTLVLEHERSISRGDMIVASKHRPDQSDQFQADLLWMDRTPLLPGRAYVLRTRTQSVLATVTLLKNRLNVETLERVAARELTCNEIGRVNLSCDAPLVFDPFDDLPETGTFVLIDQSSNQTVGAGVVRFGLRRADNIHWQKLELDKSVRAGLKKQKPCCLWFTGLSGSGKSTVASLLEKRLAGEGHHTYILDGDNIRHGLNRDLGFTDADRVENIRRVSEVAKLFVDAGLIVLVSFISPFRSERDMGRSMFDEGEFLEVFVDTPLEVCEARDPKGLYAKARAGQLKNFTGIDSAYEPPLAPDIKLDTVQLQPDELVESLIVKLQAAGVIAETK